LPTGLTEDLYVLNSTVLIFSVVHCMNKCFIVIEEFVISQLLNDHAAAAVWAKKLFVGNFAFKKTVAAQVAGIFIGYTHVASLST